MKTDFGTHEVLSRKETASVLGICLSVLDRLDIPRTRIGHRVMYKRDEINKWIDKQTEKSEVNHE